MDQYIKILKGRLPVSVTGNKAQSLLLLRKMGFRVPDSYLLTSQAFEDYKKDIPDLISRLKKEVSGLPGIVYAVRSSTTLEDSEKYSFAGQFQTVTNVSGVDNILEAVKSVWQSVEPVIGSGYQSKATGKSAGIRCAVIIQEMVPSVLSGVGFSKNPVTQAEEIIIEAIEGAGENLVQKGLTPHRWRFSGDLILEGDPAYRYLPVIRQIAGSLRILKKKTNSHIDIEWAFDGKEIYYLQLRSITTNKRLPVYSNKLAQEMLPGQIKPLVWSVNIPLVNGTWLKILSEITGKLNVEPEDLAKPFYYRAYFNMAALGEIFRQFGFRPESLEAMMGAREGKGMMSFRPGFQTIRHTFRIIKFLHRKLNFEKIFLREYEPLKAQYDNISVRIEKEFSLEAFDQLYIELFENGRKIAYLNIVVPLLMQFYNKRLAKKLSKLGYDYDSLNFHADFPELVSLSPIPEMEKIKQQLSALPEEIQKRSASFKELSLHREAREIIDEFNSLLKTYGHLSESGNDFSAPKWYENPEHVFSMIASTASKTKPRQTITFSSLGISGLRHPGISKLYRKSGKFKIYREQISSLYICGYGQFRSLFLKLGDELVNSRVIAERSDVFYIKIDELKVIVKDLLLGQCKSLDCEVQRRKTEMEATAGIILPSVIYGDVAPILDKGDKKSFTGIGTASGTYKGKTLVVRNEGDFSAVNNGDVIIIPFSDVSWTPILIKAGAIVSESGGMLSHCSIIAREMGIPSIVSVENACSIGNGITVTVDGSNGLLTLHDDE
ncbi:MAG TPA: PEP/pyruvate-binding domain-containing protein [Bacteroidales bacterium]|nr:PEP/pyruvate-binding domain-containing protein [Bacteroidales bacterium]